MTELVDPNGSPADGSARALQDFAPEPLVGAPAVAGRDDERLESRPGSRWFEAESGGGVILGDEVELRLGDVAVDGEATNTFKRGGLWLKAMAWRAEDVPDRVEALRVRERRNTPERAPSLHRSDAPRQAEVGVGERLGPATILTPVLVVQTKTGQRRQGCKQERASRACSLGARWMGTLSGGRGRWLVPLPQHSQPRGRSGNSLVCLMVLVTRDLFPLVRGPLSAACLREVHTRRVETLGRHLVDDA